MDGFSSAKLRHYYFSNPLESGDRYFKLLLSQTDTPALKAILKDTAQPKEPSLRVTHRRAELALIDLAIEQLSKLRDLPTNYEVMRPFKGRAGRKSMGKEERREVSRRMRNYWEASCQQQLSFESSQQQSSYPASY